MCVQAGELLLPPPLRSAPPLLPARLSPGGSFAPLPKMAGEGEADTWQVPFVLQISVRGGLLALLSSGVFVRHNFVRSLASKRRTSQQGCLRGAIRFNTHSGSV